MASVHATRGHEATQCSEVQGRSTTLLTAAVYLLYTRPSGLARINRWRVNEANVVHSS